MVDKRLSDNLPFVDEGTPDSLTEFPDVKQDPLYPSEVSAAQEFKDWDDYDRLNKKLRNERYQEDTKHRKNLTIWAAVVVSVWLMAVLSILFILAFHEKEGIAPRLSDTVMVALLSTTTLNVLGMMVIVLRGLFDNKD